MTIQNLREQAIASLPLFPVADFNRFTLELPRDAVADCSHAGPCDDDVSHWASRVPRQEISPESLRAELREYGAWEDDELADDAQNWKRIIWIAAGNIME